MENSLDRIAPGGRSIGEIVLAPLVAMGVSPTVVDIGARNGIHLLPAAYNKNSTLVGFEANPVEYEKLINNTTDSRKAGLETPAFKKAEYHNYAAWDSETDRNFYVTVGAGACTMMGETLPAVAGRMYLGYPSSDPRSRKSFREVHGEVRKVIPMHTKRLDDMLGADRVVDLLKIDVEGAELRVMKGAEGLFDNQNVLFVYTEFVALPYYADHPVFGDQHAFLRDKGLRLMDIELGHAYYRRENGAIPIMGDRPMLHAGDACFALDPDLHGLSAEKRQRLAAISFAFGFNSFAVSLLREAKLNSAEDIALIEKTLAQVPLFRRLKTAWNNFPARAKAGLRGLGIRNASTQ